MCIFLSNFSPIYVLPKCSELDGEFKHAKQQEAEAPTPAPTLFTPRVLGSTPNPPPPMGWVRVASRLVGSFGSSRGTLVAHSYSMDSRAVLTAKYEDRKWGIGKKPGVAVPFPYPLLLVLCSSVPQSQTVRDSPIRGPKTIEDREPHLHVFIRHGAS